MSCGSGLTEKTTGTGEKKSQMRLKNEIEEVKVVLTYFALFDGGFSRC